jgi:hypothetical protein
MRAACAQGFVERPLQCLVRVSLRVAQIEHPRCVRKSMSCGVRQPCSNSGSWRWGR